MKKDLFFTYHEDKKKQQGGDPQSDSSQNAQQNQDTADENQSNQQEDQTLDSIQVALKEKEENSMSDEELKAQLKHIERIDPHPGESKKVKSKVVKTNQKSISFKGIIVGCALFGMTLVGGASFILFSMLRNPDQNRTIIPRETGQILLVTFASVFFGVLFFLGFGLLVINAYRLFNSKTKKKFSYAVGTIMGLVLLVTSIGGGIPVISEITANNDNSTNNLVDPFVELKEGRRYLYSDPVVLLIAPTKMYFKLNENVYKLQVVAQLGPVDVQAISLSCGNGQELSLQEGRFGPCLYTEKGPYPVTMTVNYRDRVSGEQRESIIELGALEMDSMIQISATNERVQLNEKLNEMIIGTAPVKLSVDGQSIITDFGLIENTIQWDTDEDGSYDIVNNAQWTKNYFTSKLHEISYIVSGLSPYTYVFNTRVLQPDVPVCKVNVLQKQDTIYSFEVSFIESQTAISEYAYIIKSADTDNIYNERKSSRNTLDYDFARAGDYAVRVVFITESGKEGSCESENFFVGDIAFSADFDLMARLPEQASFQDINQIPEVSLEGDILQMQELPTNFKLVVNEVRPRTEDVELTVEYDGRPLLSIDDQTYDFVVETPQTHTISIKIFDKQTQESTTIETVTIQVQQEQIIGKIAVQPDTVGTEPFTVKLDASVTSINDPDDQLVYFTWDFGDGDVKKNISQGIVEHTYMFDSKNEEGTYQPSVTMTTKKGRTITAMTENPIIVKKAIRSAKISFLSHPAQLAKAGESVALSVTTDGVPESIIWTIDQEVIECAGRQCAEISRLFEQAGTYEINVRVTFKDHPDVSDKSKIVVQE